MKKQKKTIKCPCCKNKVEGKKMKNIFSLLPFNGFFRDVRQSNEDAFIETLQRFSDFYQWACDDCIRDKVALLANPSKQHYTFSHPMDTAIPYLAYFNHSYTCTKCGQKAEQSKERQQYWYEELQLVVYTRPSLCKECGKKKSLNTELSNLLKNGEPSDAMQLSRIAEIYEEIGKSEKSKAYRKLAVQAEK